MHQFTEEPENPQIILLKKQDCQKSPFFHLNCIIFSQQGNVGTNVIQEFETKLTLFPNKSNKSIHKVLICSEGADGALINNGYFDEIIKIEQLIQPRYW